MKGIEFTDKIRRIIRSNMRLVHYKKFNKPAVKMRGYDKAATDIHNYILGLIPKEKELLSTEAPAMFGVNKVNQSENLKISGRNECIKEIKGRLKK